MSWLFSVYALETAKAPTPIPQQQQMHNGIHIIRNRRAKNPITDPIMMPIRRPICLIKALTVCMQKESHDACII